MPQTQVEEKKPMDFMKIAMVLALVAGGCFLLYKFSPKIFSEIKPSK